MKIIVPLHCRTRLHQDRATEPLQTVFHLSALCRVTNGRIDVVCVDIHANDCFCKYATTTYVYNMLPTIFAWFSPSRTMLCCLTRWPLAQHLHGTFTQYSSLFPHEHLHGVLCEASKAGNIECWSSYECRAVCLGWYSILTRGIDTRYSTRQCVGVGMSCV